MPGMRLLKYTAISIVFLAPALAMAATPRTFEELVNRLVYIINYAIGSLVVLALVLYFLGILANARKAKDGDTSQVRTFLVWGLVALFVMVSIWGILQILRATLFSGDSGISSTPAGSGTPCVSFGGC